MPVKTKKNLKISEKGISIIIKNEFQEAPPSKVKDKRKKRRAYKKGGNPNSNYSNQNTNQVVDSKISIPPQLPMPAHQALNLAGITPATALSILPPPPPPPQGPTMLPPPVNNTTITIPDPTNNMMQMMESMMRQQSYTNNPRTMYDNRQITEMNDPIYQSFNDPAKQQQYLEEQAQTAIKNEIQKVKTNPAYDTLSPDEQAKAEEIAAYNAILSKSLTDNGYKMQGSKNAKALIEPVYLNSDEYITKYKKGIEKQIKGFQTTIQENETRIAEIYAKAAATKRDTREKATKKQKMYY